MWRLGRVSVFAGFAGRQVGKRGASVTSDGSATHAWIDDWHRCVKQLTVSSRENQAHHLVDGQEGFWQSSGNQGKVCVCVCDNN